MTLRDFTQRKIIEMQKRVESESTRIKAKADAEAVHDLRVAIRRLTQVLHILGPAVGKNKSKAMRQALRPIMDFAGDVRNYDIAIELCRSAKIPARSALLRRLREDRETARGILVRNLTAEGKE